MHNLLIWPLTEQDKIIFSSENASLSSITCCDPIDIGFYNGNQKYLLATALSGCKFSALKKELSFFVQGGQAKVELKDVFSIKSSELGAISLELYQNSHVLKFFIIALDDVKSWVSQLELLEVLMQENENEQKNRHNGCCG